MASLVLESLRRGVEHLLLRAHARLGHAKQETREATEAVQEKVGAAAEVPRQIVADAERALHDWGRVTLAWLGVLLTVVIVGTVLLVLLTMGLVVALNEALGDPWGTFATLALYLAAGAVIVLALRGSAKRAAAHARASP